MEHICECDTQLQELQKNYKDLKTMYNELQLKYTENTIIQSMNDMKEQYNQLLKETVPLYRYEHMCKKHEFFERKCQAVSVLLDHILKQLKKLDYIIPKLSENDLFKVQFEIITTREILDETYERS
ncbi:hypothetical protein EBU95_02265 [bacterium]|nr:hypothetical protein [bacterium]